MRVSGLISKQVLDREWLGHEHQYRALGQQPNGGLMNVEGWNAVGTEVWMVSLSQKLVNLYFFHVVVP